MAEYIEREATLKVIFDIMSDCKVRHKCRAINRNVKQIPTADVVEVVRCKDCKHFNANYPSFCEYHTNNAGYCDECCWVTENDFCSYGIKRGEG